MNTQEVILIFLIDMIPTMIFLFLLRTVFKERDYLLERNKKLDKVVSEAIQFNKVLLAQLKEKIE